MADIAYLYDSSGSWIAFRKGDFLYAPTGAWIGWFAHSGEHAFDIDGSYIGTQVSSTQTGRNRLYREIHPLKTHDDDHLGYPGRDDPPDHPGYPGRSDIPLGMEEVDLHQYA